MTTAVMTAIAMTTTTGVMTTTGNDCCGSWSGSSHAVMISVIGDLQPLQAIQYRSAQALTDIRMFAYHKQPQVFNACSPKGFVKVQFDSNLC